MNIIFDIDGTLMDIDHRRHHVEDSPKDWKGFIRDMEHDTPNIPIRDLMQSLNNSDNSIFFLSGRSEEHRRITIEHIEMCGYNHQQQSAELRPKDDYERIYYRGGHYDQILFMRHTNDYRADSIVKSELYDSLVSEWSYVFNSSTPVLIFDDRQSVVDMWRDRGLTCCQVAKGDF